MNNVTISDVELSDRGWKTISVGDTKYSIRATERDDSWNISLTNLIEIWTEKLDGAAILKKCEELNPSLSIEDIDVPQFVRKLFADLPKYATKVSTARIDLSTELEGGIFNFSINLVKSSAQQFWEEVTMPMCLAAAELQRRYSIALKLVKAKDEEISEYKLNGAELVRKHIETKTFSDNLFKENEPTQSIASCHSAFQEIVQLHKEVKMERFFIKTEPSAMCSAGNEEETMKIEAEENSPSAEIGLVKHNGASPKIEGKVTSVVQESDIILPKVETNGSPKSSTKYGTCDQIPKRAPSVRASPSKRMKKSINDLIS